MQVKCRCHGPSGSCSTRTCFRQLPTLRDISTNMKAKYNQSMKVSVHETRGTSVLRSTGNDNDPISPPIGSLVHVKKSVKYCVKQSNYTANRSCIPQAVLDKIERGEASPSSYPEYPLPPCETLCCSGGYSTLTDTVSTTCYCQFVWCCRIECDDCEKTLTRYKCTE